MLPLPNQSQPAAPADPSIDQPADERPVGEPMPVDAPGEGDGLAVSPDLLSSICPQCGCKMCCPKCGHGEEQASTPDQIALAMPEDEPQPQSIAKGVGLEEF